MLTDKLNAVNMHLRIIGESPVTALSPIPDDAIDAVAWLDDMTRQVVSVGWHFNTDKCFPLRASSEAPYEIARPDNASSVAALRKYQSGRALTFRGDRLYDMDNFTYSFEGQTIYADIVRMFDFDELPERLRQYITIRSAREFADGDQRDIVVAQLSQDDEASAMIQWRRENTKALGANILTVSHSMRRRVNRLPNRYGP